MSQNLLYVNSVGNVIVKTDNFTDGTGNSSYIRNSVQLLSKDLINPGSLVIMDAIHLPFGVSRFSFVCSIRRDVSRTPPMESSSVLLGG